MWLNVQSMPVTVAIAEDKELSMRSCVEKLSAFPQLKIIATVYNGQSLIDTIKYAVPDLILMDIEMPLVDGITATAHIKQQHPEIKILILTTFDDDEKIFKAIMAGASGYILKEESAETLYRAIMETMGGGASMSPGIALKALSLIRNPLNELIIAPNEDFQLTRRETELLEQLKNGLSYEKIASNLFISYGTVRKHIENIYRKLKVSNKVEAIQKANKNRII